LAKKGFNTFLLARSVDKLEGVKEECQGLGVSSISYPFDFSKSTPTAWKKLGKEFSEIEIGVLVNNVVGVGSLNARVFLTTFLLVSWMKTWLVMK
jgi:short-subunit dehydrogenase